MREERKEKAEERRQKEEGRRPEARFSSPSEKPILEVEELSRDYRMGTALLPVLHNVSLKMHAGETVAIIGASGSGKSTLLHIIGGLDQPTLGTVRFHDRDIYDLPARQRTALRARSIGFVFQFYHLLPELDVLENVMLPAMNSSLGILRFTHAGFQNDRSAPQNSPRQRALHLLQAVGLAERADHLPMELSGGEQQRAAVARALINEPELLLADEPTGNLDSKNGEHVLNVLFGLVRSDKRTLIMVTHNAEVAARCDRILKLQDGNMVAT